MAVYSPTELHEILVKLSQEPQIKVEYSKFKRSGILVNKPEESNSEEVVEKEDSLQHVCSVCKKKLSSAHLLDLHVTENHDSFFDVQILKKSMYACYLEECKHMSATPEDRKDHCIKVHKFPHDFRFETGKKKSTIQVKLSNDQTMDTSEDSVVLLPEKPKLTTFQFGHKTQKVFKPLKKPGIESMKELIESLPDV